MRYRKASRVGRARRTNPRITIQNGEFYGHYEPYDIPGAFIVLKFPVRDSQGIVPSERISWDGPGEWISSRDGVPKGYKALWLGTREATRPYVVFVSDTPTKESDLYDKGYRRGFKAKRRPTATDKMSQAEIEGLFDGWRDGVAYRARS